MKLFLLHIQYIILLTIGFFKVLPTFKFYDYEFVKKKCILKKPSGKTKEFNRNILIRTSRITGHKKYKYADGYNGNISHPWRDYKQIEGMEVLKYVSI